MALPIRLRLTLISTVMLAAVVAVVGLFVYVRFQGELTQSVDVGLSSRAEQIVASLPTGGALASSGQVIEPDEAFAQVLAGDGSIEDASTGVEAEPLLDAAHIADLSGPLTYEATVTTTGDEIPSRLLAVPVEGGQVVVVGASLEDQQEAVSRLTALTVGGAAAGLVFAAAVGWFVAGVALRPVERMRHEAAAISATGPDRRIAVPGTRDELARLATTLNEMLDRLDATMQREKRLVSDTSHELRTPLANLKAEIELALRHPRDERGLRDALASAGYETDRIIALTEDLLVLARAEQGELTITKASVDLPSLVHQVVESFAARTTDARVTISTDMPDVLMVNLDANRLRQAIENVLENALQHSPEGATISIAAREDSGACVVEVLDEGEGFPDHFLERAFEPFSRADEGRARSQGGAGLGLAIVQAIVVGHAGSVKLANRTGGGAIVTLRVPM